LGNELIETKEEWNLYGGQELSAIKANHIFYISADQYTTDFDYTAVLSSDELAKADRFFQQQDRHNYLLRKFALRQILSKFLQIPSADLRFHQQQNKKPAIHHLQFNTSHTTNGITVAVSRSPVGIDIEYINPLFEYNDLLLQCFSTAEAEFILTGADPLFNFYTLWTRKEAILKATGQGLVDHLPMINAFGAYFKWDDNNFKLKTLKKDNHIITTAYTSYSEELKLWDWNVV